MRLSFNSALSAGNQGASARWFPPADLDWSGIDTIYVETEWPVVARHPYLQIFVGGDAGATFTNYLTLATFGSGTTKTQFRCVAALRLSEGTRSGTAATDFRGFLRSIKKLEFRLRTGADITQANSVRVLRVWTTRARPKCAITYDNIFASLHTLGWGAATSTGWRAAGLKGTMFLSATDLDDTVNSMTAAQVQALYADGWDVGLQNSDDSNSVYCNKVGTGGLTASGSTATWVNQSNIRHLLIAGNAITVEGADQSEYNGNFVVATTPNEYTFTYTMASSPAVTTATGSLITCNRPGFSTLRELAADIAASRAVAASNGWTRGNEFFSYSNSMYSRQVAEWMEACGIKLTRTVEVGANGQAKAFDLRLDDALARHSLPAINMDGRTAAAVIADIDAAIKLGSSFCLLGHGVKTAGDSLHMATAEFETLVAGVKGRVRQGLIDVVTMTELWASMRQARAMS